MTVPAGELDRLAARLARVRDEEFTAEPAGDLFEQIVRIQVVEGPRRPGRRLAVAVSLAAAALLAVWLPALGVGGAVTRIFGLDELNPPSQTAPTFVLASGTAGIPWKLVATASDQGLCLDLMALHRTEGWVGAPICRPTDVRGDPFAPDARHWIEGFGAGGGIGGLDQSFAWGRVADDVASLELVLSDGSSVHAHLVEGPADLGAQIDYYWASWPCGSAGCVGEPETVEVMAIARDGSGRVLERRTPVWNMNPTGDPDGPQPPPPLN